MASLESPGVDPARIESARIMARHFTKRERVKSKILRERRDARLAEQQRRQRVERKWKKKMGTSPFMVDLVAESERIEEETRMRERAETRRKKTVERRKARVKNGIILKALQEESVLQELRDEKRAILEEERCV